MNLLKISPKEQTEVMERIFGSDSAYSEETRNELKQVMLVPEQDGADLSIYGKTGWEKTDGIVVDAWFTGFAESEEGNLYFCVRLGRTDGMEVSSTLAKRDSIEAGVGLLCSVVSLPPSCCLFFRIRSLTWELRMPASNIIIRICSGMASKSGNGWTSDLAGIPLPRK